MKSLKRDYSQLLKCGLTITATALLISCRTQPVAEQPATPSPPPIAVKNPLEMPSPIIGKPYYGTGVVKIINVKEGWIEINHEPIEGLMPAMEMEWWVKDKLLLKAVQVGDKVDFTVVETGKGEYITALKRSRASK